MEYGPVSYMCSKFLNESIVVYNSVRKPGFVYTFSKWRENKYRCCRCRELGKQPVITVTNDKVLGRKDPEQDHHADCQLVPKEVIIAEKLDRDLRKEIRIKFVLTKFE